MCLMFFQFCDASYCYRQTPLALFISSVIIIIFYPQLHISIVIIIIIMAALWDRAGHYIFALCFLSSFFLAYSKWSEIECQPYFYIWCGINANLDCRSEMCCMRLAGKRPTGCKNVYDAKIAIWAPSHNFVWLYLRM